MHWKAAFTHAIHECVFRVAVDFKELTLVGEPTNEGESLFFSLFFLMKWKELLYLPRCKLEEIELEYFEIELEYFYTN